MTAMAGGFGEKVDSSALAGVKLIAPLAEAIATVARELRELRDRTAGK